MNVIQINPNGTLEQIDINRKNIMRQYSIHNRDLRPVFTRKEFSVIMPRGNCIVLSVRSVKLILTSNRVLIFNLEKTKIQDYFIPFLVEKIKNTPHEERILFEHLVLEVSLLYILEKFQRRFDDIDRTSIQILGKLREKKLHDQTFEQLLHLKKRLSTLGTHLTEVEDEFTELVDDEDDLKEFYLDANPETLTDTDNIESILETMLEQAEDISHRARELEENIDDAQEILTLKMNNIRNMVIKFDLFLTAIACFFTFLAVITGLYGMNLKNHLEQSSFAFYIVLGTMGIFFLIGFGVLAYWMRRKNII